MVKPLPCHKGSNRRFCAGPEHCRHGCPKHPIIEGSTAPAFVGEASPVVGAAPSLKSGLPPRDCPRECLAGYEDGCPDGCLLERLSLPDPPPFSESSTTLEIIGGCIEGAWYGIFVVAAMWAGAAVGVGILVFLILALGS